MITSSVFGENVVSFDIDSASFEGLRNSDNPVAKGPNKSKFSRIRNLSGKTQANNSSTVPMVA